MIQAHIGVSLQAMNALAAEIQWLYNDPVTHIEFLYCITHFYYLTGKFMSTNPKPVAFLHAPFSLIWRTGKVASNR